MRLIITVTVTVTKVIVILMILMMVMMLILMMKMIKTIFTGDTTKLILSYLGWSSALSAYTVESGFLNLPKINRIVKEIGENITIICYLSHPTTIMILFKHST